MKKIIYACLIVVFCIMLFSACANKGGESTNETQGIDQSGALQSEEGEDSSIIAESSNTVSDKEKEGILNELSSQLDSALNNVNNLQDLDDSDLNVNNID